MLLKMCAARESDPDLLRGKQAFYHQTSGAHKIQLDFSIKSKFNYKLNTTSMNYTDYNFELEKVQEYIGDSSFVVLQFPEGLMRFSTIIAEQIQQLTNAIPIIYGDVVYGACNYDEVSTSLFQIDKYVHFGHTQIVSPTIQSIKPLFIPCHLSLQLKDQLVSILDHINQHKFPSVHFTSTAQTACFIPQIHAYLAEALPNLKIQQHKFAPLNQNEILGCTCPKTSASVVYSLVDGLFHMEAVCITNSTNVYQVNLVLNEIKQVESEVHQNLSYRKTIVQRLKTRQFKRINIVFGTLGQQSSLKTLNELQKFCADKKIAVQIQALQEIFPNKLLNGELTVQISCPRLTFDWGVHFGEVLNLYEFYQLFETDDIEDYQLKNYCGDGNHEEYLDIARM
ncbi:Diphthamide_biosynthesis protein [Hexamita inflata]|uniref:2-(3-amino-3-carboxypropyl)histidine synthase subunit 1 n=1 Tax=Hexamita inflata TaxID=28002 RepID=A0AA86Q5B5_9EUKA|nr:Diphthamide biosynthesis protein [Hexamita inflata]